MTSSEWDFSLLATCRFAFGDVEDATSQVHIFGSLRKQLAPPHSCVDCSKDNRAKMLCGCGEQFRFLFYRKNRSALSASPDHLHTAHWVNKQDSRIDSEEQNPPHS